MSEAAHTEAVARILARVDATEAEAEPGFPHFADPATGRWTNSPGGDWTGGFWVGMLWLGAVATGEDRYRDAALARAEALLPRVDSETVFRGFLFWYGAALGSVLLGEERAAAIGVAGARGLADLFDPVAGLIPLGAEAEEEDRVGRSATNIDGVPGGTPLLVWAAAQTGDGELARIALEHAANHEEMCVRADGSVCQSARFDPSTGRVLERYTHKGATDRSTWARAQAWAMLGYAQAAVLDRDRFAPLACRVSDWMLERLPDSGVCFWDFDDPAIPAAAVDTSATAIAAAALLKLAALVPERPEYGSAARAMVDALLASHLTPTASGGGPAGMLVDGCYNRRIGLATEHELVWGTYFLLEALLVLSGRLEATAT